MSAVVVTSLIAVVGTLSGAALTGWTQAWLARAARRETRCDARRAEALTAVTRLAALADHRRTMWVREDLRLRGADPAALTEARAASHATRSAVTEPLMTVSIVVPDLAPLARQAAEATYALRDVANRTVLSTRREAALHAADRLIDSAGAYFARWGGGAR